ncbi:MAG: efflux RND transporter permease subunit, partial [Acidobacteriota bacterium]|nr:efflux RND transporter permease subunit [Acidobacteriota bacterium]
SDDPTGLPAYVMAVVIDPKISDPYTLIEQEIITPIARAPGVASVRAVGHAEKEVMIELQREATEASGLDIYSVSAALSDDNFTLASGDVDEGGRKLLVRSVARYRSLDEIRMLKVSPTVRVGDIATVRYEKPDQDFRARAMGRPAAALTVYKDGDANGREVSARVHRAVQKLKDNPRLEGFETIRMFNQSEVIDETLANLLNAGAVGSAIAVLVLLFFVRRVRMTLVVAASIPLSLLIALTVMFFTGETINLLSLLGLMICVGLLVDNSVVVAENIHRLRRGGASRKQAVTWGTGEITLAITMSTLTTIVVFASVFLNEGTDRFFLVRLAIPVTVSLLASLAVALVLVPLGVFVTLPGRRGGPSGKPEANAEPGPLERFLARAYELTFGLAARAYGRMLAYFLKHRGQLVAASVLLFALALAGVASGRVGMTRLQRHEQTGFDLGVVLPEGTTMSDAESWFLRAEETLARHKDELGIDGWYLFHKRSGGQIRGWFGSGEETALTPRKATARYRELLPDFPGMKIYAGEESQVGEDVGPRYYQLKLFGEDARLLDRTARGLEEAFARVPGVAGIKKSGTSQPNELGLVIDRDRMRRYGASPRVVAGLVSYALRGSSLPKFSRAGREVPVTIRYSKEDRTGLANLESFRVPTESGQMQSIGTLTDARMLAAPVEIVRQDKKVSRSLTLELEEGSELETRRRLGVLVAGVDLPEGVAFRPDSGQWQLRRDLRGLALTLLMATVFIYLVMGVLFESFSRPLSILLTIPLAFIGVFGLHLLAGKDMDLLGGIGFVLLAGVVVNNGIVLVDYLNRLRAGGAGREEAILLAAERRFRPIMMTAITTIGGLVPLAFAKTSTIGLSYVSFSLTLIGGMTTATLLTLLVIPVFYSLVDDARLATARAARRGARLSRSIAAPSS